MNRVQKIIIKQFKEDLRYTKDEFKLKYNFEVKVDEDSAPPTYTIRYRNMEVSPEKKIVDYPPSVSLCGLKALIIDLLIERLSSKVELIDKYVLSKDDFTEGRLPFCTSDLDTFVNLRPKFSNDIEVATYIVNKIVKEYDIMYKLKECNVCSHIAGEHQEVAYNSCTYYIAHNKKWIYNATKDYRVTDSEEQEAVKAKLGLFNQ